MLSCRSRLLRLLILSRGYSSGWRDPLGREVAVGIRVGLRGALILRRQQTWLWDWASERIRDHLRGWLAGCLLGNWWLRSRSHGHEVGDGYRLWLWRRTNL